jgi:hypothetical protein
MDGILQTCYIKVIICPVIQYYLNNPSAEQLALERQDALELFEQHLAVVKYLSARHATKVCNWSRMSRLCKKDARGELHSVYQHKATKGKGSSWVQH